MRAGLDALLDDIVCLVALRQAAEHARRHRGLGSAGHDLDDLGLGLVLIRAQKPALIVRALPVADRHLLARAQAKDLYMLRVAAAYDRPAAEQICSERKKSGHDKHLVKMCPYYLTALSFFQDGEYNAAVKSMEFDNFESVWRRVTARDGELPAPAPPPENRREEKPCVIEHRRKSCAVRFIAGQ